MALSSTTSRVSYSGNGSTTAFSFPYYFLADADLVVILKASNGTETTQTITTHYTVSGAGNTAGGTVTMVTAPASGTTLTIYRDPAVTQDLDLVENDPMPAEEIEERLDKLTMISQRAKDRLDRAVRLTDGFSASFDPKLPAVLTADTVIKINAAGTAFEIGPTVDEIDTAAASASAAAASASAASTSASNASTSASNASTSASNAASSAAAAAASAASISLPLAATSGGTGTGTYTTGDMLYASATNTLSKLGVGSTNQVIKSVGGVPAWAAAPSGGINYASSNPDAEVDAAGYTTYADAAGTAPVDGTGGTANITWTRSTSSPLRSTASFLLTKDAVNRQGQGVAFAFTIDPADQAKVLTISMDYKIASGTYASGDLALYIVDVTNGTVIQPAGFSIENTGTTLVERATFQTASNSTSYRLCWHVASTSASAYSVNFDNISISPSGIVNGTPVTDWTSFTPTGSWTVNTTYTGRWRRVGDVMEVNWHLAITGAPSAGALTLNLPSGYAIDTAKLAGGTNADQPIGAGHITDTGTSDYPVSVLYQSTTAVRLRYWDDGASGVVGAAGVQPTAPFTFANTDAISVFARFPIAGWSSNVQMSSDTDSRVVAMRANKAGGSHTSSGSDQDFASFSTTLFDTHGTFNSTTGVYTCPVPGIYRVDSYVSIDGSATGIRVVELQKNGAQEAVLSRQTGDANGNYLSGSCSVSCNAGDTLKLRVFQNSGGSINYNSTATTNYFNVSRISGPSQVAATESVNCRSTNTAGTSLTTSTTTIIPFAVKTFDSHNAFVTDTFTCPVAGKYRVSYVLTFSANATGTRQAWIGRNGSSVSGGWSEVAPNASVPITNTGSDVFDCVAGNTIAIYGFQSSGGSLALATAAGRNVVAIERIGN